MTAVASTPESPREPSPREPSPREPSPREPSTRAGAARVLVTRIGAERVAFPVEAVAEVRDVPALEPVPLAPRGVAGRILVHGTPLPVLDAGVLLGTPRTASGACTVLVLSGVAAALLVDDVEDVWDLVTVATQPVPPGTDDVGLLHALLRRGDSVVSHVDAGALVGAVVAILRQGHR